MLEIRSTGELSSTGRTLQGFAVLYNSETRLGGFTEVIRKGAFRKSLESGANIRALYHHQGDALLGTTKAGTLRLRDEARGLAFELDLPNTTHGRDLAELVRRGDVSGCSFGFRVREGGDRWQDRGDAEYLRELLDVDLHEITMTADPAYKDTTVALRIRQSLEEARSLDEFVSNPLVLCRAWLETCR